MHTIFRKFLENTKKMKLLSFKSYADYVEAQTKRNKKKIEKVAAASKELQWIADYIKLQNTGVGTGICHGVRNGFEVSVLRNLTQADVIGTEISDTADQFTNVIQWDFHKQKPEWIGKFDFVYSNSWDHSFDPETMLKNWMASLNDKGLVFLQWTDTHSEASVGGADCFGLSIDELLIWINKNYKVEKIHWLYEYNLWNLTRYYLNLIRKPRPGIRGRRIAVVVIRNN
jgi:hypothetical protein